MNCNKKNHQKFCVLDFPVCPFPVYLYCGTRLLDAAIRSYSPLFSAELSEKAHDKWLCNPMAHKRKSLRRVARDKPENPDT